MFDSQALEIVVKKGSATQDHIVEIAKAREYAESLGIELRVIEIP